MSKKWVSFEMELLNEVNDQGPVTQVWYAFGLVAFATAKQIRVIHFKQNRQKICLVELQGKDTYIP